MASNPENRSQRLGAWPQTPPQGTPPHPPAAAPAGFGNLLDQMTAELQAHIADVERRHADALREMQAKLERISGNAVRARPAMPTELATAFARVEAGMADLVERIADSVPERSRGAEGFVFGEPKFEHSHFVFDPPSRTPIAPVKVGTAGNGEPWDAEQAEALAQLYESGEALLAKHLPEAALFAAGNAVQAAVAAATPGPLATPAEISKPVLARPRSAVPVIDREWVDQRIATITDHISKAVGDARDRPNCALDSLMARVDQFEERFATALDRVATKADLKGVNSDAFAHIELQIKDLAGEIDLAHKQLTRLDSIEQHLADLTAFAHASMDESAPMADGHAQSISSDFEHLADLAVARALAHVPAATAAGDGTEAQARFEELHTILQDFVSEQRRGDQNTTDMLETMQEAMIRLIDRLDVIDAGFTRPRAMQPAAQPTATMAADEAPAVPARSSPASAETGPRSGAPSPRVIRRRERRPMTMASEAHADMPATADVGPEQRRAININDLHLNIDRPDAVANGAAAADTVPTQPGRSPRVRPGKAQAKSGGAKRSMTLAVVAFGLVGIAFIASLVIENRFDTPRNTAGGPVAANPATASPLPLQPTVVNAPSGAVAAPTRGAPPPATVIVAPTPTAGPSATAPTPNAVARPTNSLAAPGAPNSEFTPPKAPSMPETINGDRSQADTIGDGLQDEPARPVAVAAQPMFGLTVSYPPTGPQAVANLARPVEVIRPADTISQRNAPPVAQKMAASPITTGSNPTGAGAEMPPANGELPPALVGPLSLRLAAAKGDPSAAFEVATRFAEGRGIKQDFKQALTWYQRAAAKGFTVAEYRLGTLYERGLGTAADTAKAREWYKRAAEQGNVKAMHNLAVLSAGNGQGAPDYATAAKWFAGASDHGLTDSQFNLAVLYENGLGVAKNASSAYVWYALAARGGDPEATKRRDRLLGELDVATLKAADDRVRDWHAILADNRANDARVAGDLWRHEIAQAQAPGQ